MAVVPFALVALVVFYGQGLMSRVAILTPDMAPVLAAYAGLFIRRDMVAPCVAVLAVFRGALDHEPLGLLILVHLVAAWFAALLRELVYVDRLSTQLVISFACSVLYVVARSALCALLPGSTASGGVFQWTVTAVLATLFAPFLFALLRTLRVGPLADR